MIYKSNEIPVTYNKIAEFSDNYIVWVQENTLNSGTSYNAYIQYLQPSFTYYFIDDYKISKGTNYILNANYVSNGMYNYLDNYDIDYSLDTYTIDTDEFIDDNYLRSDFTNIFICGAILVALFWFILIRVIPKTRR